MPLENYGYTTTANAPDADDADFVNFETTFTEPVLWAPLRLSDGTELSRSADAFETMDGWREVVVEQVGEPFGFTKFADLTTYVTAVHGGWDGGDAEICLRTDGLDGSYVYLNVVAHKPRIGSDYTHIDSTYIRDLKLRYTYLSEYTPSDL